MKLIKTKVEIIPPLQYDDLLNGKDIKLSKPFSVKLVETYDDGTIETRTITAPKEFTSDLASVPWAFRWAFPRFGLYNAAAVIHDWLFVDGRIEGLPIERATADRVFLATMIASGCGWRKRVMYTAVRVGGKWLWDKNRAREKKIKI